MRLLRTTLGMARMALTTQTEPCEWRATLGLQAWFTRDTVGKHAPPSSTARAARTNPPGSRCSEIW